MLENEEEQPGQEPKKAKKSTGMREFWWILGIIGLLSAILRPLLSHHG